MQTKNKEELILKLHNDIKILSDVNCFNNMNYYRDDIMKNRCYDLLAPITR